MGRVNAVLVVDDDRDCREMLVHALEAVSVRAIACGSAEEALARAACEPPPLVITDVRMSGMDGVQLARSLQALHPRPVVLGLTGDTTAGADVWCAFDALFTKPASPLDIAAMVVRYTRTPAAAR